MTVSTTSGKGVKKSEEYISGLKKISGARKRSYPTSMSYFYISALPQFYDSEYGEKGNTSMVG
jgi:hypothetical protein